jgi:hypothetical protein
MTASRPAPLDVHPLQVLVVCPRGEYLDTVRGLARHWACDAELHWTADPAAALQHAQQSLPSLAILDARIDRASGCALSRELALTRADLDVMSFDDRDVSSVRSRHSTWHWSELPRAISWWMQRHLQAAPPIRYQ